MATDVEYIVVVIDDVDLPNRLVHAYDKTQVRLQISFRESPSGILRIPAQGEQWLAVRRGYIWYLCGMLDTADQHQDAIDNMNPGDIRLQAETVFIDGLVLINGEEPTRSYARIFMMMGA